MTTATMEKREGTQARPESTRAGCIYSPNVDIRENRDELLLMVDVPGAKPENVDIHYENGELALHIRIEPRNHKDDAARFLMQEYGVGDFYRSFRLGESIDSSKIHAEVKDGVLTIHLPKIEAIKPRKITVKSA